MRRKLRVVLDTNLLLSALVFPGGKTSLLRNHWQAGNFQPLASKTTIEELIRVLTYPKFKLSRVDQEELLADFLPYAETVSLPEKLPKTPFCRDPNDVPFLQLAIAGKAKFLVTGDKDLLSVTEPLSYRIVDLDRFLRDLNSRSS